MGSVARPRVPSMHMHDARVCAGLPFLMANVTWPIIIQYRIFFPLSDRANTTARLDSGEKIGLDDVSHAIL